MRKIFMDLEMYGYKKNFPNFFIAFFMSPGFLTVFLYRISYYFNRKKYLKFLSKIFWRVNVFSSGCHISPKAKIEGGLFMPHPTGIVIGDGVSIGKNCSIYQSVTLGSRKGGDGSYPEIEDSVSIYSGAVLVGEFRVGANSVIAANSFISKDVPENSIAYSFNKIKPNTKELN